MAVIEAGLATQHRGTARAIERVLRDDAADIGAAALAAMVDDPVERGAIEERLAAIGVKATGTARLRFVLTWETDANDVDLHVFDRDKRHAWFKSPKLASGGELYKTAFGGYGPEALTVTHPRAYPYRLMAYYYRMGPMGYGIGQVQVIRADGHGGLSVEGRPFVLQLDKAWVELGQVEAASPPG